MLAPTATLVAALQKSVNHSERTPERYHLGSNSNKRRSSNKCRMRHHPHWANYLQCAKSKNLMQQRQHQRQQQSQHQWEHTLL